MGALGARQRTPAGDGGAGRFIAPVSRGRAGGAGEGGRPTGGSRHHPPSLLVRCAALSKWRGGWWSTRTGRSSAGLPGGFNHHQATMPLYSGRCGWCVGGAWMGRGLSRAGSRLEIYDVAVELGEMETLAVALDARG